MDHTSPTCVSGLAYADEQRRQEFVEEYLKTRLQNIEPTTEQVRRLMFEVDFGAPLFIMTLLVFMLNSASAIIDAVPHVMVHN